MHWESVFERVNLMSMKGLSKEKVIRQQEELSIIHIYFWDILSSQTISLSYQLKKVKMAKR